MMQKQMTRKKTAAGMEKKNLVAVVEEQNLGERQQEVSDYSAPKENNSTEKKIAAAPVEEKPNLEDYVGAMPVFVYRPFNERMDMYAKLLQDSLQCNANQQGRGRGTQPHDGRN